MKTQHLSTKLTLLFAVLLALSAAGAQADERDRDLKVMTRNLDTGTDLAYIFAATDQFSFLLAATNTFQESHASNIAERAARVAAEIHDQQPDFIALQEITRWRIGPPGNTPFTTGGPATLVVDDALQSLLAALNSLNEHYDVVAVRQNGDDEAPAIFDASLRLFNVRLTDFDAVLARSDLPVPSSKSKKCRWITLMPSYRSLRLWALWRYRAAGLRSMPSCAANLIALSIPIWRG